MTAPFSVEGALDKHVAALEEERQPDGYWHPSSLFGCARKAVYEFLGTPKPALDAKTKRIFRIGHETHEFIQTAVAEQGNLVLFLPEVKVVDDELKIKGHADGLGLYADGTWELFEFKTIRDNALKYAKELPKDDHRKQTVSYVRTLRKFGGTWKLPDELVGDYLNALGPLRETLPNYVVDTDGEVRLVIPPLPDLERIRFAYLAKGDWTIAEFVQLYNEQKGAWVESYVERLQRHVDEGTLPMRLPNKTLDSGNISPTQHHYLCGYCPFAERCWKQDEEGVD